MNKKIESSNDQNYEANDENLVRSDEAQADRCTRLYE